MFKVKSITLNYVGLKKNVSKSICNVVVIKRGVGW